MATEKQPKEGAPVSTASQQTAILDSQDSRRAASVGHFFNRGKLVQKSGRLLF